MYVGEVGGRGCEEGLGATGKDWMGGAVPLNESSPAFVCFLHHDSR